MSLITEGLRAYLGLLAREAATVEFEGPVIEARAAGADAAELEALESAKLDALRVRGLLERRARREAELTALFDTASDLAVLTDLDALLEAIVRRARQLLSTDVAYLTLRDTERGDTYMRVTDGSASARFRTLRLPMGAGLGGLVAETAMPYATADYMADERFRHTPEIDRAVKEEGLVAILGVPLRIGGNVTGVLFASNRSARPFAPEEVTLLASLAAHAAVAIDNARLLQETRSALDELREAGELIEAHSKSVERAAHAHDRMTALVLAGGGIEDVATVVIDVLGGGLVVLDGEGRRLTDEEFELDDGVFVAAQRSRTLGRTVHTGDLAVASVDVAGEPLATLVLRRERSLDGSDKRILERAALVTALLLIFRRSVADAEGRVRGELLDDLINHPESESLPERARLLGVDLAAEHVVVVARHDGGRERAAFWGSSRVAHAGGLLTDREGAVVLMLPGADPGETARRVAAELGSSLGNVVTVTAGGAGPVRGAAEVAAAYREAQRCADALVALGRTGDGAGPAELGFVGLLLSEGRDVDGFLRSALGPVLDYDARRGTSLVETLRAYFGSGQSPARTAGALHIHVNTVTQRLERIGRLLGDGWQGPERALEIQVALRMLRLRGRGI